ncbi:hypothetical protein B0O80DRAFT_118020 [Mortierella sp. GBAus27b]|nr:hypothetical protein B0O80DRAFT_118020 [Mortierella sp. GBAus27b]
MVLEHLGQSVIVNNKYFSLPKTAYALQKEHADLQENDADLSKIGNYIQSLELLSAPPSNQFPIVDARDLYIRKEYKELYKKITTSFTDNPLSSKGNRMIVTGTPGIGKSAFLVYFVVRLLAESDDGKPPIIVFQLKKSTMCYVYGGTSVVRKGDITVFEDLLDLPETWYLSDSSKTPLLGDSKSIMSASPKTLGETYQEATKEGPSYHYMAPWELDELEKCRSKITNFKVVKQEFLEKLYAKIGGIPRYVLQAPSIELGRNMEATETDVGDKAEKGAYRRVEDEADMEAYRRAEDKAEMEAYRRVKGAVESVKEPHELLECFADGRDSPEFSGRILHRWPNAAHDDYYLKWGSEHIKDEIVKRLKSRSWTTLLDHLAKGGYEISKGLLFELYVHHIFRKGDFTFDIKALGDEEVCGRLHIPANSPVENIRTVADLSALSETRSEMPLFIPTFSNFPCIDLALAPDKLFQVTVSSEHPIKQAPLEKIVTAILGDEPNKNARVGLYFVVPNGIYDKFKVQSYSTAKETTSKKVPGIITQHVKQYALKVNLDSALATESPGIDTSQ